MRSDPPAAARRPRRRTNRSACGQADETAQRHTPRTHWPRAGRTGSGGADSPRYCCDRRFGSDLPGSSANSAVPRISTQSCGLLRSNTDTDTDTRGSRAMFRAFCLSAVSENTTVSPSRSTHTTEEWGCPPGPTVATVAKFRPSKSRRAASLRGTDTPPSCMIAITAAAPDHAWPIERLSSDTRRRPATGEMHEKSRPPRPGVLSLLSQGSQTGSQTAPDSPGRRRRPDRAGLRPARCARPRPRPRHVRTG